MGERRRDASYWVVGAGIAAAVVVGLLADARVGAFVLAAVLAAAACVRAVRPEPGPEAIGVRRRWLDVVLLVGLAIALVVLAVIVPNQA
jgi:hypothetical protein